MSKRSRRWNQVTTIQSFRDLKTVRVFGIARVSTDKQAKKIGESLDHQKEVLVSWVKAKSNLHTPQEWNLIELYVENEDKDGVRRGRSATTRDGRLGLAKALELAQARMIDLVVVTKLDRIARNVRDYIDISAEFNQHQVALVCLDLDIDTSTPDGQMIMRNHANLAQWQAERIAQYSLETAKRHVEQGRPLGSPTLGYQVKKDENGKSTYEIDPLYRKHVELMDKLYLRHQSVNQVVDELHKLGYKSPKGNTYSKPQVSRFLQNIRYTGRQEYEGKVHEGNWPSLRTIETQEQIQKIFEENRRHNRSPLRKIKRYVYYFQTLLKCHRCHSSMIARPGISSRNNKYYPYYACMRAEKTDGIDCELIYLPAETVDQAILGFIKQLRLKPGVIQETIKRANQATDSRIDTLEKDLERIKERLKDIRTKLSNLADIVADKGRAAFDALKDKFTRLEEEEKELVLEEQRVNQEIRAETVQAGSAHDQIQTLNLFSSLFLLNEDKPERIKALLPRFVNYVACEMTDRKKGIGQLTLGLFVKPFLTGPNAELWHEALTELAERYNDNLTQKNDQKIVPGDFEEKNRLSSTGIARKFLPSCGTNGLHFAGGLQLG